MIVIFSKLSKLKYGVKETTVGRCLELRIYYVVGVRKRTATSEVTAIVIKRIIHDSPSCNIFCSKKVERCCD